MFVPAVQKWTPMVLAELTRQKLPLPIQLILGVIQIESGGHAGVTHPKSGASGLMQVMPGTLRDFNKRHKKQYTLTDLRSSDLSSAQKQIEVGVATISTFWKSAYQYLSDRLDTVPIDELSRIADLFYVAGPGATKQKLNKLSNPSWAAVQAMFPGWNALPHPRNVFDLVDSENTTWDTPKISAWLDTGAIVKKPAVQGFAAGILLLAAAYWFMQRKKGPQK